MQKYSAFHRTELLIGEGALRRLAESRVILFGTGGVGSWCAEALIRSGVGHLTIVDNDAICVTNINRQLQATAKNVGQLKVEALKKRLLEIHPDTDIQALQKVYTQSTRDEFNLSSYDYVIDAIDSLSHKVDLIASAMELGVTLFSAMGAACKLDATSVRVDSIWKTHGCKLAKFVRRRLRHYGATGDCLCVYSKDLFSPPESAEPAAEEGDAWSETQAQVNGSMVHMTGVFGFNLAGLVVQDVVHKTST